MNSINILQNFINYRTTLFNKYKKGIIRDISSVGFGSFYYVKQNKIKHKTKATETTDLILNYLIYNTIIERNTVGEKILVMEDPSLEDLESFQNIIQDFENKRDRILKKIITSKLLKIKEIKEVKKDLIEVLFEEYDIPFYLNKKNLNQEINIPKGKSLYSYYIPFIYYNANF